MRTTRTTVEIGEDQRLELLHLAAQKGMKGFSLLVQEAIQNYLNSQKEESNHMKRALKTRGAFRGDDAEQFEQRVKAIRQLWR